MSGGCSCPTVVCPSPPPCTPSDSRGSCGEGSSGCCGGGNSEGCTGGTMGGCGSGTSVNYGTYPSKTTTNGCSTGSTRLTIECTKDTPTNTGNTELRTLNIFTFPSRGLWKYR